jgi:hypothetical protein
MMHYKNDMRLESAPVADAGMAKRRNKKEEVKRNTELKNRYCVRK